MTLAEEEETLRHTQSVLITAEDTNTWPPWPWPPWGGDEEDGDDEGDKPHNRTPTARKLAKKVLKFETKLAKASLDL